MELKIEAQIYCSFGNSKLKFDGVFLFDFVIKNAYIVGVFACFMFRLYL